MNEDGSSLGRGNLGLKLLGRWVADEKPGVPLRLGSLSESPPSRRRGAWGKDTRTTLFARKIGKRICVP